MASAVERQAPRARPRLLASEVVAVLLVAAAFGKSCSAGVFWDDDAYFLVATGRALLEDGFTGVDPLTVHSTMDWSPQQWGSAVAFALADALAGKAGIVALAALAWALAIALAWRCALRLSGGMRGLAAALAGGLAVALVPFLKTNPRAVDLAVVLAMAMACHAFASGGRASRYAAASCLCSAALACLHSAMWPLALLAPAAWAAFAPGLGARRRALLAGAPAAATVACFAVSPLGLEGLAYLPLSLLSPSFAAFGIQEVGAPSLVGLHAAPAFAALLAVGWAAGRGSLRRDDAPWLALAGAALLGGLASARLLCVLDATAVLLLARLLRGAEPSERLLSLSPRRSYVTGLAALVAAVAAVSGAAGLAADEAPARTAAVEAVEAACGQEGLTVLASANDGAYLEFRGHRAYIDARFELFCPEVNGGVDVAGEYTAWVGGKLPAADVAASIGADAVVLPEALVPHGAVDELAAAGYSTVLDETAEGGYLAMARTA